MTLAKYGWWLDSRPKDLVAFSTGAAANAVNLDSFHVLQGTPGSPGALSEFTLAAWFYYDGANDQIVDFESYPGIVSTNPFFQIGLGAVPSFSAVNWHSGAGNQFINNNWSPTLPSPGWVWAAISVQITSTVNPGAANVSLVLCQRDLGRAGDQSDTTVISAPGDILCLSIPDFNSWDSFSDPDGPHWFLDNDAGFNDAVGGVDWVAFVPTYYDFTVQANRELFTVDDGGTLCPVDPTPLSPLILFRGDATEFATNQVDSTVWAEKSGTDPNGHTFTPGGPLVNYPAPFCFVP